MRAYLNTEQKIDQFNASVQELYYDLLDSKLVGGIVDFGKTAIEAIDGVIDSIGTLSTAIVAIVAGSALKTLFTAFTGMTEAGGFLNALSGTSGILGSLAKSVQAVSAEFAYTGSITQALKGRLTELMGSINGVTVALLGVAAGVAVFSAINNAIQNYEEEQRRAATETATSWGDSDSELSDYKDQITELREALDSGTLSEEEALEKKTELLTIQDSLSESYGSQVEGIDLVNGAYEEQLELLNKISTANAQIAIKEQGKQFEEAKDKIEDYNVAIGSAHYLTAEEQKQLYELTEPFGDYFEREENQYGEITLKYVGNAEEAEGVLADLEYALNDFQKTEGNEHAFDWIYEGIEAAVNDAAFLVSDYGEMYDNFLNMDIKADENLYATEDMVAGEAKTATEYLNDYSEAIQNYNEALQNGDASVIEESKTAYQELAEQIQWLLDNDETFANYSTQFERAGRGLDEAAINAQAFKEAIEGVELEEEIDLNFNGKIDKAEENIKQQVNDIVTDINDMDLTDIELKTRIVEGTDDELNNLMEIADLFGLSMDDVVDAFAEAGVVTKTVTEDIEEASSSLADMLASDEDNGLSAVIDQFQSDIDDIQSALDDLRNGEEVDLTNLIQDFPELTGYMDDLESGLESLQLDRIQEFSDSLSDLISGKEWSKSDFRAFDDMFSNMMSGIDFSAYADQYRKSLKSFTTMMSQSSAYQDLYPNFIDQLESAIGENEYEMEAVVMLSMNPDAANWTYQEFCQQLENAVLYIQLRVTEDSLTELQDTLDGLQEEQDLIESSQSLSEAMNIKKTTKDYKDLINNSKKQVSNLKDQNNLLKTQESLYKSLGRDTKDIESQINDNTKAINSALEDQIAWNNEALALNYNQAAEGIDAIRTALSEATSDTLLSSDSITNLINTLSDLEDFDATEVFHQTADGVDLNTTALKHLEDEYVALKKQDYQSQLAELGKEYQDAQKYLQNYTDDLDKMSTAEKDAILAAAGYRGLSDIESDITYVDLLSNELDGLTSAYQTWINAQSQGSYADAFQSMGDYYSTAEDLINRGWIGNEGLNAYLDLMLSADQRTGDAATDFEKLTQTIEGTDHSLMDYFQYDENGNFVNDGIYDFMDDVIATMGDAYARLDEETGQYEFGAWSNEDVQALADRFGTSTDFIWKMIDAMREAGFEIQTTEDYIQDAINAANVDTQTLQDLQAEGKLTEKIDVDYDVEELSADEIEGKLGELDELEHELFVDFDMGEIDWDTYMEALSELEALRDSLNGQDVRIRVEEEIEEGNLQELDEIISQGEYEEEIALRFGIDTSEEGWQDEVHAIAQVIQEEAEAERIEMTVESKIEETGMTAEELSNEIDGLSNQEILDYFKVEGDASEAEAIIEYINEQAESEKTWDMTVKIDDEQFEQLTQQQEGTVDINADTSEAMGTVEEFIKEVEGMEATIQITTSSSGGEESTETSGSLPAADGTVNYTVGEYPTEIEEPASGTVDYEVGEYPTTIEEHASSVVDYEVGEYPTTIEEHASGIADYEVGDYPKDIPVNADVNNAETAISGLKAEIESIDATISVNVDTETLASQLGELNSYLPTEGASVDVTANVSGTEDVNALTNAIGVLTGKVVQVIAQVTGEGAVNSLRNSIGALVGKVVQVIAQVAGQASVDALRNSIAAVQSKTVTVTSISKTINEAMGTAHAEGTTIMNTWNNYRHSIGAYANGTRQNWALPRNETALTNETGQESIVFKMRLCMATCIENLSNC